MSATPFNVLPGILQGRIAPAGWTPPDGAEVICLGSDAPGRFYTFADGDKVELTQTGDVTGALMVPFRARLRGPSSLPLGATWVFSWLLAGVVQGSREVFAGRTVDLTDDLFDTAQLPGNRAVTFRLQVTGLAGATELELPGVYFDALVLSPTAPLVQVANRAPEPNETGVPLTSTLFLQFITSTAGDTLPLSSIQVHVNGVLAFDGSVGVGGTFFAPYNGPGSLVTVTGVGQTSLLLDPVTAFSSLELVTVQAAATSSLDNPVNAVWSFTCADKSPPVLVAAAGVDLRTVRATFNKLVEELSAGASFDALNPANYALSATVAPSFLPNLLTVEPSTGSSVLLTFDQELSPGIPYLLTVTNVDDTFGNTIAPPTNAVVFTSVYPEWPPGRELSLYKMLPEHNLRIDQRGTQDLAKFIACLQEVAVLLLESVDRFADILDPDVAPEQYVDLMLLELGNPFPFVLSLADKRRLVQVLLLLYQQKGTDQGIVNAVRFFTGLEVTVFTENQSGFALGEAFLGDNDEDGWILGPGGTFDLYSFLVSTVQVITNDQEDAIETLVEYMKPAHTHFLGVVVPGLPPGPVDDVELGLSRLGSSWILH